MPKDQQRPASCRLRNPALPIAQRGWLTPAYITTSPVRRLAARFSPRPMPRPCRLCGAAGVSPFPEQPPWRRPNCNGPVARAGVDRVMDGFVTETMLDESETEMRVSRPHGAPAFDELVALSLIHI